MDHVDDRAVRSSARLWQESHLHASVSCSGEGGTCRSASTIPAICASASPSLTFYSRPRSCAYSVSNSSCARFTTRPSTQFTHQAIRSSGQQVSRSAGASNKAGQCKRPTPTCGSIGSSDGRAVTTQPSQWSVYMDIGLLNVAHHGPPRAGTGCHRLKRDQARLLLYLVLGIWVYGHTIPGSRGTCRPQKHVTLRHGACFPWQLEVWVDPLDLGILGASVMADSHVLTYVVGPNAETFAVMSEGVPYRAGRDAVWVLDCQNILARAAVRNDETVLVTGGSGGVGLAAGCWRRARV
jgi:hypothetical protein